MIVDAGMRPRGLRHRSRYSVESSQARTKGSQLCYRWARRAGLRAVDPDGPLAAAQTQAYFETRLPYLMLKALARVPDRFDALLVDEGRDFTAGEENGLTRNDACCSFHTT
jgi:hypothetical protein